MAKWRCLGNIHQKYFQWADTGSKRTNLNRRWKTDSNIRRRAYLVWGFVAAAVVSSAAILVLSHRLAGPVVRLIEYLKSISERETANPVNELHFRKGEFFGELPEYVNKAVKNLQTPGL